MILNFEGYPTLGISEKVELPPVAEILRSPMFIRASIDDFYKQGGEFNRYLLSKCPITNDYKHICVTVNLKCLTPEYMPMATTDWHCDGSVGSPYFSFEEKFHILVGYTDLVTEFLAEEATLEVDESLIKSLNHYEFRRYIESQIDNIHNLKPKLAPESSYVTFNSKHLHRAPNAPVKGACFRLMVIVRESNHLQASKVGRQQASEVWSLSNDSNALSIEQIQRGIVLRSLKVN